MTLKSTVSGRYSSYPSAYRNTARGEVIRKPVDYDDPLSVIGAILEEIDCKNHFTRSRVYILAEQALRSGVPGTSLVELINIIRFEGADEFCKRFSPNQDEIPTKPSAPNPIDVHWSASKTDVPPVQALEDPAIQLGRREVADAAANVTTQPRSSRSGLLIADLTKIKHNIAAALQKGADNDPVVFTDEASAPSSRRFPKT